MSHPPYLDKAAPEVHAALVETSRQARHAAHAAGLSRALVELVNTRVSQVNGCVSCLSVHQPLARRAGVDQLRLDLLTAWRDAPVFDDVERAALALAEALTGPDHDALPAARARVEELTSAQALVALEWVVVVINAFNRVSIASGHPPVTPRDPAA